MKVVLFVYKNYTGNSHDMNTLRCISFESNSRASKSASLSIELSSLLWAIIPKSCWQTNASIVMMSDLLCS